MIFSTNNAVTIGRLWQIFNLERVFTHFADINSKQIIDINEKWKTIKHLKEKLGKILCGLEFNDEFLAKTAKIWSSKNLSNFIFIARNQWKYMNDSQMHIAMWKKLVWKCYILHDSNHIKFCARQNYSNGKQISGS